MEFFSPQWTQSLNKVRAVTTMRHYGNGEVPYDSLNLAKHVGDDEAVVDKNRKILATALNLTSLPFWLNQTHSVDVTSTSEFNENADGIYSQDKNTPCIVMTADCLPVFLTTKDESIVGSLHAGWRGLCNGIIENAINIWVEKGIKRNDILVAYGPAIGKCCFEVGEDVKQAFMERNPQDETAFTPVKNKTGHYLANIYQLANTRLENEQVEPAIIPENLCTVCSSDDYFSYRKDNVTGRIASLIWKV